MPTNLTRNTQPQRLLTRILEHPDLVQLVQSLEPPVLKRLIDSVGLEDAGEIVALATTGQLEGVFDEDLWRSDRPGKDEEFDASRFALWLEVMLEAGPAFAAGKLAELDPDLVTLALCKHLLVIDVEALSMQMTAADRSDEGDLLDKALESCLYQELEEFRVIARDVMSFDAIVAVLVELDRDHHEVLRGLLERCCEISGQHIEDNGSLYDVLTSGETLETDVAADREDRRERQGFVAPSSAASFLASAQQTPVEQLVAARDPDPITRAHFRARPSSPAAARPPAPVPARSADVAGFLEMLREAEVLSPPETPLLAAGEKGQSGQPNLFREAIAEIRQAAPDVYAERLAEIGYLANVLIAGCAVDGRAMRPLEAAEVTVAVCNAGLQHVLAAAPERAVSWLRKEGAVKPFRIGWSTLLHGRPPAEQKQIIHDLAIGRETNRTGDEGGIETERLPSPRPTGRG
jgi:hypothetical protein